jgi:hypothetical protein
MSKEPKRSPDVKYKTLSWSYAFIYRRVEEPIDDPEIVVYRALPRAQKERRSEVEPGKESKIQ